PALRVARYRAISLLLASQNPGQAGSLGIGARGIERNLWRRPLFLLAWALSHSAWMLPFGDRRNMSHSLQNPSKAICSGLWTCAGESICCWSTLRFHLMPWATLVIVMARPLAEQLRELNAESRHMC